MSYLFLKLLAYALLPMSAVVSGAVLATFRPPARRLRGLIQHFAAGMVFSVVAVVLLPDVVGAHTSHPARNVVIGFAAGVALMLGLRSFIGSPSKLVQASETILPMTLLVVIAVNLLIGGFLIGIGFIAGTKEGMLLTLALTVELFSLGLGVAVMLIARGATHRVTIITLTALALFIGWGAISGVSLFSQISAAAKEVILSFGLAALLFRVLEDLLVEAKEAPETPPMTATFFTGFLLFLVLGMVK